MGSDKKSDSKYIPVKIGSFRTATRDITFDVYIQLSNDNFAHVFSRSTGLDYKRLAHYIQKDVKFLYIKPDDAEAYKAFVEKTADQIFQDPSTPTEKKIATLLNMTEQNMTEIFAQLEIPDETAENTIKVVQNYVKLMFENPKSLTLILRLVSHGDYLYYHAIATATFSMFIAKATGQFNKRMLEIVGLGGFLHDIGCTQLPKEINDSESDLTEDQWKEMRKHPSIGLKMLENTANVADEVKYIVYQHHEQPSGNGYPNKLRGPKIYYPAKIVSIADSFSALISKRPFRPAYKVEEAVEIMMNEKGKFDSQLLKIVDQIFVRGVGSKKAA